MEFKIKMVEIKMTKITEKMINKKKKKRAKEPETEVNQNPKAMMNTTYLDVKIKIEEFAKNGFTPINLMDPINLFLASIEACAAYNGWNDRDKLVHIKLNLKGNAAHVLDGEFPDNVNYADLVVKLE